MRGSARSPAGGCTPSPGRSSAHHPQRDRVGDADQDERQVQPEHGPDTPHGPSTSQSYGASPCDVHPAAVTRQPASVSVRKTVSPLIRTWASPPQTSTAVTVPPSSDSCATASLHGDVWSFSKAFSVAGASRSHRVSASPEGFSNAVATRVTSGSCALAQPASRAASPVTATARIRLARPTTDLLRPPYDGGARPWITAIERSRTRRRLLGKR